MIGTEVQIESGGRWRGRRIRRLPMDLSLGRRKGFDPVSQSGTVGGGYGAAHIDKANMDFDRLVSNATLVMSAMR